MSKKSVFLALASVVCLALFLTTSCATLKDKITKRDSRTPIKTVMVTGNFTEPRLICELAQYRNQAPLIIFMPAENGADPRMFYLSGNKQAEEMPVADFAKFLDFLNPKVVIFLGGDAFCPQKYIEMASSQFRVYTVTGPDWVKNAQSMGDILAQPRLLREYKDAMERLAKTGQLPPNAK